MARKKRTTRRRRRRATPTRRRGTAIAKRAKGMLAIPRPKQSVYVTAALIAGQALKEAFDIPYVEEDSLGLYVLACLVKNKETKQTLAEVALGMQLRTVAKDAGIVDQALGLVGG